MKYILTEGSLAAPADEHVVDGLLASLGFTLPSSYADFIRKHNGGEGFIGDNYIIFWKVEDLADFNREYEVDKYAPGIFLFGSSGGGEGYGFDLESAAMPVVRVPFIGMARDEAEFVADDLLDLFTKLSVSQ